MPGHKGDTAFPEGLLRASMAHEESRHSVPTVRALGGVGQLPRGDTARRGVRELERSAQGWAPGSWDRGRPHPRARLFQPQWDLWV